MTRSKTRSTASVGDVPRCSPAIAAAFSDRPRTRSQGGSDVEGSRIPPGSSSTHRDLPRPTEAQVAQVATPTCTIDRAAIQGICATEDRKLKDAIAQGMEQAFKAHEERFKALETGINQLTQSAADAKDEGLIQQEMRTMRTDVNKLLESQGLGSTQKDSAIEELRNLFQIVMDRLAHVEENSQQVVKQTPKESPEDEFEILDENSPLQKFDAQVARRKSKKRKRRREKLRRKRRRESGSTSSSSEEHDDVETLSTPSDSEGGSSVVLLEQHVSSTHRAKGPKHDRMKELKPNNPLFDRLLSYRYYRLNRTTHSRSAKETGKVRDHIKRLELTMQRHRFSGEDPILVLDFLNKMVDEANTLGMSEAQAYLSLPYFLSGSAESQFRAVRTASTSSHGGISCWPEAVQYLLRTYATPAAIRDAIQNLRETRQKPGETETAFSVRLNEACFRCGNVYPEWEKMTLFIDGLDPAIRSVVARHREQTSRKELSFEQLVHFAQDEGDSLRARSRAGRQGQLQLPRQDRPPHKKSRALLAGSSVEFREHSSRPSVATHRDNVGMLRPDEQTNAPLLSSYEPSITQTDEDSVRALPIHGHRQVHPNRIPYQEHSPGMRYQRPGWQEKPTRPVEKMHAPPRDRRSLICHTCYAKEHVAPDCSLPLRSLHLVVENFERLTEGEKTTVPIVSYLRAKAQFNLDGTFVPTETRNPQPEVSERHPAGLLRPNSKN